MPATSLYGPLAVERRIVPSTTRHEPPSMLVLAAALLPLTLSSRLLRQVGLRKTSSRRRRQRCDSSTTMGATAATITCNPQAPTREREQMAKTSERMWTRFMRLSPASNEDL